MLFQYERRLWENVFNGPKIQDTVANHVTICRGKAALYGTPLLYTAHRATDVDAFLLMGIALIILCAMADRLDGYLAVKLKCESESGRCLDPVADAFIVFSGCGLIVAEFQATFMLLVPIIGNAALGVLIFLRRLRDCRVRTHLLARVAIVTIYAGGLAFFAAIVLRYFAVESSRSAVDIGHDLFWAAFALMTISTICYYCGYDITKSFRRKIIAARIRVEAW